VIASKKIISVSTGHQHTLLLSSEGMIYGLGSNAHLQIGQDASVIQKNTPVVIGGVLAGKTITAINAVNIGQNSFAVTSEGHLYSWGGPNDYMQLGLGRNYDLTTLPVLVPKLSGIRIKSVSGSRNHALAVTEDGKLYGWGSAGTLNYCIILTLSIRIGNARYRNGRI
jgi:alpha-tubulin suppressor-like RCC1 family protein